MTSANLPRLGVRGRRPRLRGFDYRGPFRYFVTISTYENKPLFTGRWPYDELVVMLSACAGKLGFDVLAYTFMPEHVHLLIEGAEASDAKEFVRLFKSRAGYFWKRKSAASLWQKSYYDRVLRSDEDSLVVARYVFNNAVRRGLTDDGASYAYSGSFVCSLRAMF